MLGAGAHSAQASPQETYKDHDLFLRVEQDGQVSFVRIDMLMFEDGSGVVDSAALDAAKAEMVARFPGAVELEESAFSAQYVTSGFKWAANTANWGYNTVGAPVSVAGSAFFAASAAASTWGFGSNYHFTALGPSSAGTGACGGGGTDGQNTVGWANQAGSVLAVTCSWYGPGSPFGSASEFDMQIDPEWSWSTGGAVSIDLQSVVLHEFGHALGLNHSADGSAVMYASYSAGSTKRSLTADDQAGLVLIYGSTSAPTNTPTNTPLPGTATHTPTSTPTKTPANTPTPTNVPPTNTPTSGATQAPATPTATATQTPPASTATPTATKTPGTTPESGAASATPTKTATAAPGTSPTAVATAKPTSAPNLPIVPGSNLLAWPGSDQSPAEALGNHGAALKIVYEWDAASGEWKRYAPGLPNFVNNLSMMRKGHAYWFIANAALQLPF